MIPAFAILVILTLSLTLLLGAFIFLSDPKRNINKVFLFITLFSAWWIFTNFIVDISKNIQIALIFSKITIIGPIFIAPLCLYFSLIFPREKKKIKFKKLLLIFLPAILFLPLVLTRFNVEKVWFTEKGLVDFKPGIFYQFFLVYIIFYFVLFFVNLLREYKQKNKIEKVQILYLFTGFFSALIISLFTNLILPLFGISDFLNIGISLAMVGFISFTAYSVLKHHLMNVKVIAAEILVAIIAILLLIQTLGADTISLRVFNGFIFFLYCFFGYLLIRSVLREVKLKEDLAVANKELKKLDEAKTEFLSIASHQLRTPLTAIKGYLGMVDEGIYGKVSEEIHKILHKVDDSNERLVRLVNSLLDISRLEMGRMEFELEEVNIEEMIESIVDELHVAAKKKEINLIFEHPEEEIPEVTVDPLKIRQVIINLVDNAIKYTYKGEVIVRCKQIGDKIQISVSDTGMGIARKEIKEIFKIYRRGTGVRLFPEGSGVGLYVARKLIEAHHGKIWVESKGKGKGSIFFLELSTKSNLRNFLNKF